MTDHIPVADAPNGVRLVCDPIPETETLSVSVVVSRTRADVSGAVEPRSATANSQ